MAKKVVLLTGGLKQIAGLIYNDTNAVPQRNKQCAWRARLAMATSVSQLAMQVYWSLNQSSVQLLRSGICFFEYPLILLWRNDSQMVDLSVLKTFTDRT
jgi:hypothetical protein